MLASSFNEAVNTATSTGRDLLNVNTPQAAMAALRVKCNGMGTPDFSGLRLGDYLDLPSLTVAGTTYTHNAAYNNLRIVLSGLNTYKGCGNPENTKNHLLFTFRHCVLTKRINASDTNAGGYPASELKIYLDGSFKTGLQSAIGDYIYPVSRGISKKGNPQWFAGSVWLPTEIEVFGGQFCGDEAMAGTTPIQIPVFAHSYEYRVKRQNGSRQLWRLSFPYSGSSSYFCYVSSGGNIDYDYASEAYGIAPAFCVA